MEVQLFRYFEQLLKNKNRERSNADRQRQKLRETEDPVCCAPAVHMQIGAKHANKRMKTRSDRLDRCGACVRVRQLLRWPNLGEEEMWPARVSSSCTARTTTSSCAVLDEDDTYDWPPLQRSSQAAARLIPRSILGVERGGGGHLGHIWWRAWQRSW